jgi:hypothetical protein
MRVNYEFHGKGFGRYFNGAGEKMTVEIIASYLLNV